MSKTTTQMEVNDYLDLFLYAQRLNDKEWQEEIKQHLSVLVTQPKPSSDMKELLGKYQLVRRELSDLYQKLREPSQDHTLYEKLWSLKKEQKKLRNQIKGLPDFSSI